MSRSIYWFKNDLRLHDNSALNEALMRSDEVVPVYIIDASMLQEMPEFGFIKTGPYRWGFLMESLNDLNEQLLLAGRELMILFGETRSLLTQLMDETQAGEVVCQDEIAFDERALLDDIERSIPLKRIGTSTLFSQADLTFELDQLPDIFTSFRKKVESTVSPDAPLTKPDLTKLAAIEVMEELHQRMEEVSTGSTHLPKHPEQRKAVAPAINGSLKSAFPFKGGETAGIARIDHYFEGSRSISRYKETRNGLIGLDYSSKLSAWLANGSLSPRYVYNRICKYEGRYGANESTYWLYFELLWREYFQWVSLKYGNRLYLKSGIKEQEGPGSKDDTKLNAWINGQTRSDFVNANMNELRITGWMSNRGRQNVASYLVHDLGVDWRYGAAWFESRLIDYDPSSNWGNWCYVAGVGNDPRPNRKFNVDKQRDMYDPDGKYTWMWTEKAFADEH